MCIPWNERFLFGAVSRSLSETSPPFLLRKNWISPFSIFRLFFWLACVQECFTEAIKRFSGFFFSKKRVRNEKRCLFLQLLFHLDTNNIKDQPPIVKSSLATLKSHLSEVLESVKIMNASKIKPIGESLLRTQRPCHTTNCASNLPLTTSRIPSGIAQRRFLSSKSGKGKVKKPKLSKPGTGSVEAVWCTSARGPKTTTQLEMGKYGLKRLDYTTMHPPVWTTPPHPPTKTLSERIVFPLSIVLVAGIVGWVYMSPEEDDMTEYWKRVESGQILMDDDDDDDYEDDEDEE